MKKHFHPNTMENLERVWKAEQKAKEEAEKLEQLQRELEEERRREALQQHAIEQGIIKKKNEKLDWMYAGPQVNHEEYLLGRKIDKNVDILKEDEKPDDKPGASFMPDISDPVKDMAAKIKEDPLFLIRKKEEESKKELVQNPIKLRKLKEMLNLSVKEQKKNKKSKKSKHKKDKERKRKHQDDSDIDDNSQEAHRTKRRREKDRCVTENGHGSGKRYMTVDDRMESRKRRDRSYLSSSDDAREVKSKGRKHREKSRSDDAYKTKRNHRADMEESDRATSRERKKSRKKEEYARNSTERKDRHKYTKEAVSRKYSRRNSSSEDDSESSDDEIETSRNGHHFNGHSSGQRSIADSRTRGSGYGLYHPKTGSHIGGRDGRHRAHSKERAYHDSEKIQARKDKGKVKPRHDSSSDSSSEKEHSRRNGYAKELKGSKYERSRGVMDVRKRNGPPPRMISDSISRKLTQEELEKRRQEMMENAKWRDDQRGKNIKKYKLEEEKETNEEKNRAVSPDTKAKFIHDLQVKSYSSSHTSSVEDRIKRNIYTKQRTRDALSKKFTEK